MYFCKQFCGDFLYIFLILFVFFYVFVVDVRLRRYFASDVGSDVVNKGWPWDSFFFGLQNGGPNF